MGRKGKQQRETCEPGIVALLGLWHTGPHPARPFCTNFLCPPALRRHNKCQTPKSKKNKYATCCKTDRSGVDWLQVCTEPIQDLMLNRKWVSAWMERLLLPSKSIHGMPCTVLNAANSTAGSWPRQGTGPYDHQMTKCRQGDDMHQ